MNRYQQDVTMPVAVTTPDTSYLQSHTSRAFGPLMQSLITGVMVGTLVGVCCVYYQVADAWFPAVICGLVSSLLMWFYMLQVWSYLVMRMEQATGRDIDGDGQVGAEVTRRVPVRVEVTEYDQHNNPLQTTVARFDDEMKLIAIADAVVNRGVPFSENALLKAKVVTPAEFAAIRDEMILRHWLKYKDAEHPQQGYTITKSGAYALRDYAAASPAGA